MEDPQAPQYYYDSSAQQWWYFDTTKGDWEICPENEQTGPDGNATGRTAEPAQQQELTESQHATATSATGDICPEGEGAGSEASSTAGTQEQQQQGAGCDASAASAPGSGKNDACAAPAEADIAAASIFKPVTTTGESLKQSPDSATSAATAPRAAGSGPQHLNTRASVYGAVTFKIDSSASAEAGHSSRSVFPDLGQLRYVHSSEETDAGDELGSALDRLMTSGFSIGFTRGLGEGTTSSSFPWQLGLREESHEREEEEQASSGKNSSRGSPEPEPIVRRVTRCMTFKEQGGLSGCLKKAVELRKHIIDTEKGGHVPGAEDTKEEAWKIRARATVKSAGKAATERAKSRWRTAALELAGQQHPGPSQRSTPNAGAQRFADIVGLVAAARKKSLLESGLSEGSPARRNSEGTDAPAAAAETAAATATAAKHFPGMWEGRRSSEMHGRIRFADATLRDPTNQLQVSDLLGATTRRHSASAGETKPLLSASEPQR